MGHVQWPTESGAVAWSDEPTRASLRVIAEAVAAFAGFEHAVISVEHDGVLEVVATSGSGKVVDTMLGTHLPVDVLAVELAKADDWGVLRFVPHERVGDEVLEYSFVSDVVPLDGHDAWHPLDLLTAPFYDDSGALRGLLSVDVPLDGRRPGADQRLLLTKYAEVARSAVLLALEREDLAERVRLAGAARDIVRRAVSQSSLEHVIAQCRAAVVSCFGAVGMWLQAFDADGWTGTTWYSERGNDLPIFEELLDLTSRVARTFWADQYVGHFSADRLDHPGLSTDDGRLALEFLRGIDVASVLFVPLGVGSECLGFLVLSRTSEAPEWTDVEADAAMDIGLDLARVMANARRLEREQAMVAELQALDVYKGQLISTVAHELRNPLGATMGNLELLEETVGPGAPGSLVLEAAVRGTRRMEQVIDDLLDMAQAADPRAPFDARALDLRAIAVDVEDENAPLAEKRRITLSVDLPDEPVVVDGDPVQLHRALSNLVSNAVKYSTDGGTVELAVSRRDDEVVVRCRDHGIGISEADRAELFTEFFRSTNPEALAQPGTGLGLAITQRIVRRHGGRVHVESRLGEGTTVSIVLPAPT